MKAKFVIALMSALLFGAFVQAAFVSGPVVLDEKPQNLSKPTASLPVRLLNDKKFPQDFLASIRGILSGGKSVLIVGNTDTMGPKLLNNSLGLQYSISAAQKLADELKTERARFFCASAGELAGKSESVLEIFPYDPPPTPQQLQKSAATVLEPMPDERLSNKITIIRAAETKNLLLATEDQDGLIIWETLTNDVLVPYEFGSKENLLPFGGNYKGAAFARTAGFEKLAENPQLALKVEETESGVARLSGKAPAGVSMVTVWAGPFPYPVDVENGRFDLTVALLPYQTEAYGQAVDSKGNKIVGISIDIPPSRGEPPEMIAVLLWEGAKADLDLHGWKRAGHSHPQDSDPSVSAAAADGVKILFDGESNRRASALTVADTGNLEIEIRCFSDFGDGATAFLYILENPGDKLARSGKIIGPRKISGEGSRWLALKP